MVMISKQSRHPHMNMNTYMTLTKIVTNVYGSPVQPSGWTPHEKQYRNFLPT